MSNKTIIHNKVRTSRGIANLSMAQIDSIHKYLKKELGESYVIVTTPTDLTVVDGDLKIIKIDCKEYSHNELMDAIEKAWKYDELTK